MFNAIAKCGCDRALQRAHRTDNLSLISNSRLTFCCCPTAGYTCFERYFSFLFCNVVSLRSSLVLVSIFVLLSLSLEYFCFSSLFSSVFFCFRIFPHSSILLHYYHKPLFIVEADWTASTFRRRQRTQPHDLYYAKGEWGMGNRKW